MTVLVVDHGHSTRCGIRDLGVRIADRLGAIHADCNSQQEYVDASNKHAADVVIVNYRRDLMLWWRPTLRPEFAVLHNYSPDTVNQRAAELIGSGFDRVLVLDPTVTPSDPRVHAVGRPLPRDNGIREQWSRTRIGSFGYAFPHKGFVHVATEAATVPDAVYALHMPEAHFNGASGHQRHTDGILTGVRSHLDVYAFAYTSDDLFPDQLVQRLTGNTVNCLLYKPGQPDAGLSSALDYLIAARRPILVSSATMFAAAQGRAAVWPDTRLADVLDKLDYWQDQADDLWQLTHDQFRADVTTILEQL